MCVLFARVKKVSDERLGYDLHVLKHVCGDLREADSHAGRATTRPGIA
jgi:hypothetical protein